MDISSILLLSGIQKLHHAPGVLAKHLLLFCGMSFCCAISLSAGDSLVVEGNVIEVSSGRLYASSSSFTQLDTADAAQHLGSALLMQTTAFIRMQSASGLATGGVQAAHTTVLWNGFPIQSPMNGVADLAAVLPGTFGKITVLHDAQSAFLGSGIMGPAIVLDHKPIQEAQALRANFTTGSFGLISTGGGFTLHNPNTGQYFSADYNTTSKHNRFTFPNRTLQGSPLDTMRHAGVGIQVLTVQAGLLDSGRSQLKFHAWLQSADREIPASLTGRTSQATQDDRSARLAFNWKHTGPQASHEWRAAWFWQDLLFADPLIRLNAYSNSHQWLTEYSMVTSLSPNWLLRTAMMLEYTRAGADDYMQTRTRLELNGHASVKWTPADSRFMAESGLRIPVIDGHPATISPFVNFRYKAPKGLHKVLSISKNYRHPTLNDLYWIPYGNPELKPEHAWTASLLSHYRHPASFAILSFNPRIHISYLENMIQWLNEDGSWKPVNHQAVLSRGGELELEARGHFAENFHWQVSGNYSLSRSTVVRHAHSQQEGQKLRWMPEQRHIHGFRLRLKDIDFTLQHQFTGRRYAATDQSILMPAFNTFNARLSGMIPVGHLWLQWHVACENLSNRYYEWFPYQPMPGRSIEAGIKATLNIQPK